jgi:hypothetical protein
MMKLPTVFTNVPTSKTHTGRVRPRTVLLIVGAPARAMIASPAVIDVSLSGCGSLYWWPRPLSGSPQVR